jgi:hypothetical protein
MALLVRKQEEDDEKKMDSSWATGQFAVCVNIEVN